MLFSGVAGGGETQMPTSKIKMMETLVVQQAYERSGRKHGVPLIYCLHSGLAWKICGSILGKD